MTVWVAGHRGLLGRALCTVLADAGRLVLRAPDALDLRDREAVRRFVLAERPKAIVMAAGRIAGAPANLRRPALYFRDNLDMAMAVIDAAVEAGTARVVMIGSAAAYPEHASSPIAETALHTGPVDDVHLGYSGAKLAAIAMAASYRREFGLDIGTLMPSNLYGPHGNFDPATSQVLAALIRRAHEAAATGSGELVVYGHPDTRREFLHAEDCARAVLTLLDAAELPAIANAGAGRDVTLAELVDGIVRVTGFAGRIRWEGAQSVGAAARLLDSSLLRGLGWAPRIELGEGLAGTYDWYRERPVPADAPSRELSWPGRPVKTSSEPA